MSQRHAEKENATQSDKTTKFDIMAKSGVKITELLTTSPLVEMAKIGGTTIETMVKYGNQPTAIILAIAVLIASLAIPIVAFRLSPSQINPPAETSQIKN